jgi:hypothetical protein
MSIWKALLDPSTNGSVASAMVAEPDGTVRIVHGKDQGSIDLAMKRNREMRNRGDDGYTRDRTMRRAATIEPFVAELWRVKHGVDILNPNHREKVLELLDSPEYSGLKTVDAKLSRKRIRTYFKASTVARPPQGTIIRPGE